MVRPEPFERVAVELKLRKWVPQYLEGAIAAVVRPVVGRLDVRRQAYCLETILDELDPLRAARLCKLLDANEAVLRVTGAAILRAVLINVELKGARAPGQGESARCRGCGERSS